MKNGQRKHIRFRGKAAAIYLCLGLWLAFTVVMIGWIILASLSTTGEIFSGKLLESGFHIENYIRVLEKHKLAVYFGNSLIYSIAGCVGIVLIAAPAAYILGRFVFTGKKLISNSFVTALSIPVVMLILPLYKMATSMHLTGSRWVLILLYIGVNIPFGVYFLTGFFCHCQRHWKKPR